MNDTNALTKYVGNFVDELSQQGVRHVVISPGSRSTPLAVLFLEHKEFEEWILVDERSAAFFALGIARKTNQPVVLVCTSGTAAANYYPAVIEAHSQRIPLIVLTADRPHELRDVGAPQAMNQIELYGNFVKWFQEMALPDDRQEILYYVRSRAARSVFEAQKAGNPGPVHLNFPFREPLMPNLSVKDIWGYDIRQANKENYSLTKGTQQLSSIDLKVIKEIIREHQHGLIVCGPHFDRQLSNAIVSLSGKLQIPILADPLSQLRSGNHSKDTIIEGYDALLKDASQRGQLKPDYIIRFGAMPISKSYLHFVQEHKNIIHIVVEDEAGIREPTNQSTHYVWAHGPTFCTQLANQVPVTPDNRWLHLWQSKNDIIKRNISHIQSSRLTEGEVVRELLQQIPSNSTMFVANSMPVRDLDTFFMTTDKEIDVYGNRGVSGIDGINSTALGIAAADNNKHVTLVIGDLSFYHDLNGLLVAKKYGLNLTVVLINNEGGGIFSFLPQAKDKTHFEALFGTPLNLEFSPIVTTYGGLHYLVDTYDTFRSALKTSYTSTGLHVIEVRTNREENVHWHRDLWEKIHKDLQ